MALVSRLLNAELTVDLKFAPCGACVFARDAKGDAWRLLRSGDSNAPYVTENAKTTRASSRGYRPRRTREVGGDARRATGPAQGFLQRLSAFRGANLARQLSR